MWPNDSLRLEILTCTGKVLTWGGNLGFCSRVAGESISCGSEIEELTEYVDQHLVKKLDHQIQRGFDDQHPSDEKMEEEFCVSCL